jgi:hypothetical protein
LHKFLFLEFWGQGSKQGVIGSEHELVQWIDDALVIFKEYTGSINSEVFTWKNNGKLEVAQHIADYEIGHSARKKLAIAG